MGRPPGWATKATGRPPMRSPGRPPVARRDHRQRFWLAIAEGLSSEDAAAAAGVSPAVGARWFREGGGMPTVSPGPPSGRYLSFAEREEVAILHAQGASGRAIARRLGRAPSTISREVRRNAATRGGKLGYRATTAQWHAERRAKRPKVAKLAGNDQLHCYVQEPLSGTIVRPDGVAVVGPEVRWIGRRHGRRQHRRWAQAWSPEQISNRLQVDFPDDASMRMISLARRSSQFSRSSSRSRSRSSLVSPGRVPASTSARRTHVRSVSAVIPNFEAIEVIVAHCDVCSALCSKTMRGPLANLCWVPASSCHRPILSEGGASNFPGAVHDRVAGTSCARASSCSGPLCRAPPGKRCHQRSMDRRERRAPREPSRTWQIACGRELSAASSQAILKAALLPSS